MPTYTFQHIETEEQKTILLSLAEREKFIKENTDYFQVLSTPSFGDSIRLGIRKHDNTFNDMLKRMKKNHLGSTIEIGN